MQDRGFLGDAGKKKDQNNLIQADISNQNSNSNLNVNNQIFINLT